MHRSGCCFKRKLLFPALSLLLLLMAQATTFALGTWKCATGKAPFAVRADFGTIVFGNKLWVLDGYGVLNTIMTYHTDSWNTTDGTNWTRVGTKSPYPMHSRYGIVVFKDNLWVLAGHIGC